VPLHWQGSLERNAAKQQVAEARIYPLATGRFTPEWGLACVRACDLILHPPTHAPALKHPILTLGQGQARAWGSCACACPAIARVRACVEARENRSAIPGKVCMNLHHHWVCTVSQNAGIIRRRRSHEHRQRYRCEVLGFDDLKGIGEFRDELASAYVLVVSGRAGAAGGITHLLVELTSTFSLAHLKQLILDGVAFDLLKNGAEAFVLRPFIAAYRHLQEREGRCIMKERPVSRD
jgi:hypothetical protein